MRKPMPIKIIHDQDERCSIREDHTIEFAGKTMTLARAEQLSKWLATAVEWIKLQKR